MVIKKKLGILLFFLTFTCVSFQTFGFFYPEDYDYDVHDDDQSGSGINWRNLIPSKPSWLRMPSWLKKPSWIGWPGWPSSWVGGFLKNAVAESYDPQAIRNFLMRRNGGAREAIRAGAHMLRQEIKNGELDALLNEGREKFDEFADDLAEIAIDHAEELLDFGYDRYKKAAFYTFLGIGALIGTWYGSKVLANHIERRLKQPRLIDESSFKTIFQKLQSYIKEEKAQIKQMVFPPDIEVRLNNVVASTRKIAEQIKQGKTNVKFRNLFLYGPPGTGKTMFARELPKRTGIPYALISGASFSQFKNGEGVTAMNELFAWAYKNNDGFILIIDEADSFLYKRENMEPNSEAYQLLNNFLKWTGTRNGKFMIVLCANHKSKIDSAMFSRIDDYVEITLPKLQERTKVLTLYRNQILLDVEQNAEDFIDSVNTCLSDHKILEIATRTDGFSNRELEGIINNIKTDADISPNGLVTEKIIDLVVGQALEKYYSLTEKTKDSLDLSDFSALA